GKGLGGGLPLSCIVADAELMDAAPAFAILTTSGNPVATSAGVAVLGTIDNERLTDRGSQPGAGLLEELRELADKHAQIGDVRGAGLAIGIDLVTDRETKEPVDVLTTAKVIYRCYELGLHLIYVGLAANVLELTPSLLVSEDEASSAA